jgi:hypothetical protein
VPLRHRRLFLAVAAAALLVGACNDDGRDLRPARPDQNDSVSTSAVTTLGTADGGIDLTLPPTVPLETVAPTDFAMTAPWPDGGTIDPYYTCDGSGVSPALIWSPAPAGTQEIAVAMIDEDQSGFIHWVMAGIDPMATSLLESEVPEFASVGVNDMGQTAYSGPCPPSGETHRYRVTVYALAQRTEVGDGSAGVDLLAAIEGSAFLTASATGSYSRP